MTLTAPESAKLNEVASEIYEEQREDFIDHFAEFLKSRIESGLLQSRNGQSLSLEESKAQLFKKAFNETV